MDRRIKWWIKHEKHCAKMRADLNEICAIYLADARKAPFPEKVRPAVATDIVVGAVIWYKAELDGGPWWKLVLEVHRPADLWKGYDSEDGDRCGLDDAYVEVEDE